MAFPLFAPEGVLCDEFKCVFFRGVDYEVMFRSLIFFLVLLFLLGSRQHTQNLLPQGGLHKGQPVPTIALDLDYRPTSMYDVFRMDPNNPYWGSRLIRGSSEYAAPHTGWSPVEDSSQNPQTMRRVYDFETQNQ